MDANRALYHCNYCSKDISLVARIKCAVCPDFDLCLECFSVGVEITPHKNDHDYRVVDNLSFPILHMEWGVRIYHAPAWIAAHPHARGRSPMVPQHHTHAPQADEEILLLEAIDIYGAGNWASVSEHVGNKTPEHCKRHWFATYIDVDSYPCPTPAPELAHLTEEELRAGHVHVAAHQGGSRKRPRDAEAPPSFLASSHVKQEGGSGGGGGDSGAVADQIGAGHQADLKVEEPSAVPSGEAGEPLSGLKRETRAKKEHPEPHPSAGAAAADTQVHPGQGGGGYIVVAEARPSSRSMFPSQENVYHGLTMPCHSLRRCSNVRRVTGRSVGNVLLDSTGAPARGREVFPPLWGSLWGWRQQRRRRDHHNLLVGQAGRRSAERYAIIALIAVPCDVMDASLSCRSLAH